MWNKRKSNKNNQKCIEESIEKYNQEIYDLDIDLGSIPQDPND